MDPADPVADAWIIIQTLGYVEAVVRGAPARFEGGGVGRFQLIRMLAYLVIHRDRPVSRHDLAVAAGGRVKTRQRFRYVVTGMLEMLRSWGLSDALTVKRDHIILHTHPSWRTDTDALVALYEAAEESVRQGDPSAALDDLEQARLLCRGRYFNEVELLVDDSLREADGFWLSYQRQIIYRLIELLRADDSPTRFRRIVETVNHLFRIPTPEPRDYALAVEMYELCGQHTLANLYRKKLR